MYKFFIFLLFFIVLGCENNSNSGKEESGCKSDNSCDKNLYCNLETKTCEVCSVVGDISTPVCSDRVCTVPLGNFCMGCQDLDGVYCNEDELPYHKVYLNTFKIDQYEVTVKEFKECVKAGVCKKKHIYLDESTKCNYNTEGKDNYPMNCINWTVANDYCKWKKKRLPTEAEWEKAARGVEGRIYPWGTNFGCKYSVVNPDNNSTDNEGCSLNETWSIGSLEMGVSPYGLYDMSGNVMEWVSDFYSKTYYTDLLNEDKNSETKNTDNPKGPKAGNSKVLRGGGWRTFSQDVYTFRRTRYIPDFGHDDYGFRCAKTVKE